MKLNKICYLAVGLVLAMTSCKEGQYWNEASNTDAVYAFPKSAATISLVPTDEVPDSYVVMVTRNEPGAAVTLPVEFSTKSELLSGADEITFAAGETQAFYTINIENNIQIGEKHTVTLSLETPEENIDKTQVVLLPANQSFTFTIGVDYTWENAGTALVISQFAGNSAPEKVPFQKAKEYSNGGDKLLRLISPYYAMDPDYSEDGINIQFTVDSNNDAIALTPAWQYTGERDSNGYYFLGTPASYGCSFTNDGNVYTVDGIVATADSPNGGTLTPRYYETFMFQLNWNN